MEKYIKYLVYGVLFLIGVFMWLSLNPKEVGATYQPSFHTEWKNEGHVKWGECKAVAACGTTEGTQTGTQKQGCKLVLSSGSSECTLGAQKYVEVSRSCEVETPACEEPKDYCDTLEGVQSEDADCPPVEEEEPPVVPPVDTDDDEDNEKCEAPSKVQGFRFQFVGEQNRLRWTPKGSVDKVDIAVYGMDKTTLLYNVRTADDGEYFVPTHTTWHKIRAVGNCGLSKWSKLIN